MSVALKIFLLLAGGSTGSMLRGWLGERFMKFMPWVTLGINVSGSFAAGWLSAWGAAHPDSEWVHILGLVGFCGGFTTFSTMAVQSLAMWREHRSGWMVIYLTLTLTFGLAAAWAGLVLGRG